MFGQATRDLKWGIHEIRYPPPQVKRFRAFCVLRNDTFASSDGKYVTLWTPNHLIKVLELPALSMHYIKSISHIVAFCHGTSQLVFAQAQQPYFITKHPQLFSNKIITTMHYFEQSGVLVCAGQGLMFSRLVIPQIFKSAVANPEMLKIEKLTEHYQDILFTSLKAPVFVDSREIVIVYNDNNVWIHNSDGDCVQKILGFTEFPITCVSYYDVERKVVAGDESGMCAILEFEVKDPFKKYAVQDPCRGIERRMAAHAQLLYAGLYARGFMLAISLDNCVTLTHLKTSTTVQSWKSPINAIMIRETENQVLLFSVNEVVGYRLNIFTDFFCDLETDALFLQRCPSAGNAARVMMFNNHSVLTLMSPKNGLTQFAVRSGCYKHDIKEMIYSRNIVRDGGEWRITECGDIAFLLMSNSTIVVVNFEELNEVPDVLLEELEGTLPLSSITSMQSAYLKMSEIQVPLTSDFAAFVRIDTPKYPGCVIGLCRTGHCNIFSGTEMKMVDTFWLGFRNVLCAAFSSKLKCLVIVGADHIILYNVDQKRVEVDMNEKNYYTCMMIVDDHRLVCGCANGELEIRNLPTLTLMASSQGYNAYHTERGERRSLTDDEMTDLREMRKVPFSIRYMDYCSPREAILTISPIGEVMLWDLDAFPLVRLDLDINPTAACFQNGYGSLLISALNTIFVVDWRHLFHDRLEEHETELDDFDMLEDNFSLLNFRKQSRSSLSSMHRIDRVKSMAARARIRRVQIECSDDETEREERRMEERRGNFDDLLVLQKEIPKEHYLAGRGNMASDANPRRKFIPPKMPPLIEVELIEKKESLEDRLTRENNSQASRKSATKKRKGKKSSKNKTASADNESSSLPKAKIKAKKVKSSDNQDSSLSALPKAKKTKSSDNQDSALPKVSKKSKKPKSVKSSTDVKIIGGEQLDPKSKGKNSRSKKSLAHSRTPKSSDGPDSARRLSVTIADDDHAMRMGSFNNKLRTNAADTSEDTTAERSTSIRMPSPNSFSQRISAPRVHAQRRMTYHDINQESAQYKLATDAESSNDEDEKDVVVDIDPMKFTQPNPRMRRRMSFIPPSYNQNSLSTSLKTLPSVTGPVINITCYGPKHEFTNHFSEYIDSRRSSKAECENVSTGSKSLTLLPSPELIM